jgi:hypothetical protein
MAKQVAALVKGAQEDGALRRALMENPELVAREKNLPAIVVTAAARALTVTALGLAALGVWY